MYRALRLAFPTHSIVCVSSEGSVWLSTLNAIRKELIDKVLLDQPLSSVSRLRALIRQLGPVEYVLDIRSSKRTIPSYLATTGLNLRYLACFPGFALRHNIPGFGEIRPSTNALRWHRMAEIAAGRLLPFETVVPVMPEAASEAARLVPIGNSFIGLSPGPAVNKFWGRDKWLSLAAHAAQGGNIPVFLIGPQEQDQREWIDHAGFQAIDASTVRDPLLLPWIFHALADRAVCIVAAESGLGHLAATRSAAILTLAGPTNARLWRPITPHHWVVEAKEFESSKTEDIPLDVAIARLDEIVRQLPRLNCGLGKAA